MIRLADLPPLQVRILTRMAGPFDPEDATGIEAGRLTDRDRQAALELASIGLAETVPGWGGTLWFMLTDKGRKLREEGETK